MQSIKREASSGGGGITDAVAAVHRKTATPDDFPDRALETG
jgi:hypothetical protein